MKFAFWAKLLTTVSLSGSAIAGAAGIGAWTQPSRDNNNLNLVQTKSTMAAASTSLPFSQAPAPIPDNANIDNVTVSDNYVYVGTGYNDSEKKYDGLYWSDDYGQSFSRPSGAILNDTHITNVTVSGNYVYVGTISGFYWSTDYGRSFRSCATYGAYITNVTVSDKYVYVGTKDNGLYWSSNYGQGCSQAPAPIPTDADIYNITANGNYVYVGTIYHGLYWSSDNGQSFSQAPAPIPTDAGINNVTVNGNYVYVGTVRHGLYWSNDNGQSFSQAPGVIPDHAQINNITAGGNYVYVGTNNGLYWSSDNGQSFSRPSGAIPDNAGIENVTVNGNYVYVGTGSGLYWSDDYGKSFSRPSGAIPVGAWIHAVAVSGKYVYAGTWGYHPTADGLYWSTDYGQSFSYPSNIPTDAFISNVTVIDPSQGYGVYVGTTNGLWISSTYTADLFTTSNKPFIATESKNHYIGWVFKQPQLIQTKSTYLKAASIDNWSLPNPAGFVLGTTDPSAPTHQLAKHRLDLIFKDKYRQWASLFGGNPDTGAISFNLWIKTNINQDNIKYSVSFGENLDDQKIAVGGNVAGCPVIMTERNDGYTQFPAPLTINTTGDDQKMIDYSKSYYVAGAVTDNNFTAAGQHQAVADSFGVAADGIYQLVFTDFVGNQYTSYLELGKDNHIIKTEKPNPKS